MLPLEVNMVKITVNGTVYEVSPGRNLLQTCLGLGFDIPYFCFHHAMGSVGACRQCAVKKFAGPDDKKGKIIMSCMEPVTDGLIISTDDHEVKAFRSAVIESLMTNHPHDCPICDEGGECHLQDMTVMTGHDYRRFVFRKRTYVNQYLGPFIQHEMNRCIQCYRCLRFYTDYAGGKDFCVAGSANNVYFGRYSDGVLESEFSGNLAEVCPTGVFTDKTLAEHYARKWDLTNSPSICVHCSLGCNTIVGERYGSVRRIRNRYNGAVNGYFICDRGRYGYQFLENPSRIIKSMARTSEGSELKEFMWNDLTSVLEPVIKGKKLAGIGSPRASLESNFALETLVGKENFYHGIDTETFNLVRKAVEILKHTPAHSPSMKEVEKSDALLILGEDLTNSAPILALSVRQATRNKSLELAEKVGIPIWNDAPVRELAQGIKSPVFIAAPYSTKLDELAEEKLSGSPEDIARLGFTVAGLIDPKAPKPVNQDKKLKKTAQRIADILLEAMNPVIITGLQTGSEAILEASANIALALSSKGRTPSLSIVFPECNTLGLGLMDGKPVDDLISESGNSKAETLIVLENDLYDRIEQQKADAVLGNNRNIIVLDHLMNNTCEKADIVLPSGTFAESTGTIVSNEGRAQRYYRVLPADIHYSDSWRTISELISLRDNKPDNIWKNFDDVASALADSYRVFAKIRDIIPDSEFRIFGEKIARQTLRFSGRTAMTANIDVNEPKLPEDDDSPLAFSMEPYKGPGSPYLNPFYWSPGWNSVQATNQYIDEPDGNVKGGNPGVLLFGDKGELSRDYYSKIPEPFRPSASKKMLFIKTVIIFGSEELSSSGKAISGLIPEAFILVNEHEAKRLSITSGDKIKITVNKNNITVGVRIDNSVGDSIAGLALSTRDPYISLPAWGTVEIV
jgi:NADH-quinone oxidoreductase subunit G